MSGAQHASTTGEWGSPPDLVTLGRAVLGHFDVDPASSEAWNALIGAWRWIDADADGLVTPWWAGAPTPADAAEKRLGATRRPEPEHRASVWLNPPGDRKGALVAGFWRALAGYHALGWATSAIWIGFSLEQLSRLQRQSAWSHPLDHATLIPCRRISYLCAPGTVGAAPTHASFVTLLSTDAAEIDRFHVHAARHELGVVVSTLPPARSTP